MVLRIYQTTGKFRKNTEWKDFVFKIMDRKLQYYSLNNVSLIANTYYYRFIDTVWFSKYAKLGFTLMQGPSTTLHGVTTGFKCVTFALRSVSLCTLT